jgi:hypothetical protein
MDACAAPLDALLMMSYLHARVGFVLAVRPRTRARACSRTARSTMRLCGRWATAGGCR